MPLTRMEHFLLLTEDMEATRDFYRDVLGLKEGFRPSLKFPGYWLYLDDVPVIHIAEWQSYSAHSRRLGIPVTTPAAGTGSLDHIAFSGTDPEGMTARLESMGVAYTRNDAGNGDLVQLFLRDPNGIKIELNVR